MKKVLQLLKCHPGPLNFPSHLGLDILLSQTQKLLKLWKAISTHHCLCLVEASCPKKPLRWKVAEMSKASSSVYVALGEGEGAEEGDAVKGSVSSKGVLHQSVMGSLQTKVKVWVCWVPLISDCSELDQQALFCRGSARQANKPKHCAVSIHSFPTAWNKQLKKKNYLDMFDQKALKQHRRNLQLLILH